MSIFDFFRGKNNEKENPQSINIGLTIQEKYRIAAETDRLNNLGTAEHRKDNIAEAMFFYKKALDVMPTNDDALINLANCYNYLGDYSKAIELCDKAIMIDPNRSDGYRTIGESFYKQKKIFETVKWWRKSAILGDESTYKWLIDNRYSIYDEDSFLRQLLLGNNNPEMGYYIFCSNKHQRYQNGIAAMGLQVGHVRNIKIEKNISDCIGYSVTILNPNPNPLTGSVTMATKQMTIIKHTSNNVVLRGYGNDMMGSSFADYGITIHHSNDEIEKVVLHMHDRNINIEYLI